MTETTREGTDVVERAAMAHCAKAVDLGLSVTPWDGLRQEDRVVARMCMEAATADMRAKLTRLRAENEALKEALQSHFLCVYLDGRNEHGSHVLEAPGSNIDPDDKKDLLLVLEDQDLGFTEEIIKDAEALGYQVGNSVVTLWDITHDPEWGAECEYRRISPELTAAMCGSPEDQGERIRNALQETDNG
jgi:hypothetical protein